MVHKFVFPIPFSDSELQQIQADFNPEHYRASNGENPNQNRIWAKPVRDVLVPRYKQEVARMTTVLDMAPHVAFVLVGNDPSSRSYVTNLDKLAGQCGIERKVFEISESKGQVRLISILEEIALSEQYTGVIAQLPLPNGFDEYAMRVHIPQEKDIDVLNPLNVMKFVDGRAPLLPATVGGLAMAIHAYGITLNNGDKDTNIAILGQGKLVGMPVGILFGRVYQKTFLSANENSPGMPERLQRYDVLVCGTGQTEVYDERVINPKRKQVLLDIDFGVKDGTFVGGFTENAHRLAYASMRNPQGSGLFTQLYAIHNILTLAERKVRKCKEEFELYKP